MTSTAPFTRLSSSLMPNETAICWPTIKLLLRAEPLEIAAARILGQQAHERVLDRASPLFVGFLKADDEVRRAGIAGQARSAPPCIIVGLNLTTGEALLNAVDALKLNSHGGASSHQTLNPSRWRDRSPGQAQGRSLSGPIAGCRGSGRARRRASPSRRIPVASTRSKLQH